MRSLTCVADLQVVALRKGEEERKCLGEVRGRLLPILLRLLTCNSRIANNCVCVCVSLSLSMCARARSCLCIVCVSCSTFSIIMIKATSMRRCQKIRRLRRFSEEAYVIFEASVSIYTACCIKSNFFCLFFISLCKSAWHSREIFLCASCPTLAHLLKSR